MDFLISTTIAYDITKAQCYFFLGQEIDLNTLVWIFSICFVIQKNFNDHFFLTLKS